MAHLLEQAFRCLCQQGRVRLGKITGETKRAICNALTKKKDYSHLHVIFRVILDIVLYWRIIVTDLIPARN